MGVAGGALGAIGTRRLRRGSARWLVSVALGVWVALGMTGCGGDVTTPATPLPAAPTATPLPWVAGPGGHSYVLTQAMTWTEAETFAVESGGHLVTLSDAEEEAWVQETFGREETFWIGINDIEEEGRWVWVSGETVGYTNWEPGQPDVQEWEEDVAVMNHEPLRQWHDWPVDNRARGVVERAGS